MKIKSGIDLVKATFGQWSADKAPRLGAALAFYSVLSMGPLLMLALSAAGLLFGHDAAQGKIVAQIQGVIGDQGARAIQDMLTEAARKKTTGTVAAIIGLITLFVGASGVFGQLQDAMNTIWQVKLEKRGILSLIQHRFLSFSMVLGTGFLLLTSLVLSSALAALDNYTSSFVTGFAVALHVLNAIISIGVISALFALIFKYMPDAKIAWRDVWIGAVLTAILFTVGKFAIGLYIGHSSFSSSYGAAGSLVVILVWIYYSAQILFFGAEFTQVYANRFGSRIEPKPGATQVTAPERAEQGMGTAKANSS